MKNIVTMMTSIILGVITLLIVMTLQGRMNRSMEIKSTVPTSVEAVTGSMLEETSYSINEADVYAAELIQHLSVGMNSDSNLKIEVIKMDIETGLLTTRVTEEFMHPNGNAGSVSCVRSVILDK